MKKRIWLIGIIFLVICCAVLLRRSPEPAKPQLDENSDGAVMTNALEQPMQVGGTRTQNPPASLSQSSLADEHGFRPRTVEESNFAFQKILGIWQAPIEFYGKVVDQNGNPVSGAAVGFHWVESPTEEGNRNTNTTSDSQGRVSLHGVRGPSLSVSVSKEGYYAAHRGERGFKFGVFGDPPHLPDPQNPVVFHLKKKGQGIELITSENGVRLKVDVRTPKDDTPVRVDLLQKAPSPTGELEISQIKPPWREATEWSFRVSIPDGGLIENADEFQFNAPEANYLPTVEYHFTKSETNWTTQVTKQFYITFGQPRKYGWLRIESNLAQETVFLTYAINPDGSRNLEPK